MTRRYYRMEMQHEESGPNEVTLPYIISADLSGPPRPIHVYSGFKQLITTLNCKAGKNDDFAAVVSDAYKPLKVVSFEEFTFGIVGISRGDVLAHLMELGVFDNPFNRSPEEVIEDENIKSLQEVLKKSALEIFNRYLQLYTDAIIDQAHKQGLKIKAYTVDQPFAEDGRPVHPVYPSLFLPEFLHNTIRPDLMEELEFLNDVVESCADAAYEQVFADLTVETAPSFAAASGHNGWLH